MMVESTAPRVRSLSQNVLPQSASIANVLRDVNKLAMAVLLLLYAVLPTKSPAGQN